MIYYVQRCYLPRERKCENYGRTPILQALATVPVPVTEPGTGGKFVSGPNSDG